MVNGSKLGTLRFCGTTDFAAGVWAGVALDSADGGRNDGSVRGVVYFRCRENHGVFVPAARVAKVGRAFREESKPVPRANVVNHGKVDTSNVVSRLTDCLNVIEEKQEVGVTEIHFPEHTMKSCFGLPRVFSPRSEWATGCP